MENCPYCSNFWVGTKELYKKLSSAQYIISTPPPFLQESYTIIRVHYSLLCLNSTSFSVEDRWSPTWFVTASFCMTVWTVAFRWTRLTLTSARHSIRSVTTFCSEDSLMPAWDNFIHNQQIPVCDLERL